VTSLQSYDLYGSSRTLPARQYAASVGDRVGPLSLFAAFSRTDAQSQPVSVITAASAPAGTTGACSADLSSRRSPSRLLCSFPLLYSCAR